LVPPLLPLHDRLLRSRRDRGTADPAWGTMTRPRVAILVPYHWRSQLISDSALSRLRADADVIDVGSKVIAADRMLKPIGCSRCSTAQSRASPGGRLHH